MARALELAGRGLYTTDPNPRVGCVLRAADQIVGEGWHEVAGGPHAEVAALAAAGARAAGATAYVTLEPCAHHGRTPPCVDALIAARVRRVVFACHDPNPAVDGRGAQRLAAAGIEVASGLLGSEAAELNVGFMRRMRTGRPFVRLKLAMSLDGRTALANGKSQWITGEAARLDVQHWRARSSAVLAGIGTVRADDPRLTVRGIETGGRQPLRVILDRALETPAQARVLAEPGRTLIFTISADEARADALRRSGAEVERIAALDGRLDLAAVLQRLGARHANELLIEAGSRLAGAFVEAGLVDEYLIYMAPVLLGPQARELLALPELEELAQARRLELIESTRVGADLRLRLRAGG